MKTAMSWTNQNSEKLGTDDVRPRRVFVGHIMINSLTKTNIYMDNHHMCVLLLMRGTSEADLSFGYCTEPRPPECQ